jgi:hypothetical protein
MVEIRIFGKLHRYISEPDVTSGNMVKIEQRPKETMGELLARINIPADEVHTIFLNFRLLASRSKMAYRMGYQQVDKNPLEWELDVEVKAGDRVGLFGRDMSALVV